MASDWCDHRPLNSSHLLIRLGHYARIDWNADSNGPTLPRLLRGIDKSKDQSYWLSGVASQKLSKVCAIFAPAFSY